MLEPNMATHKITTLTEFFQESGAKYRIFDMGRRVTKLSPDEFSYFERAETPYPYPFQQAALFGVVFWDPSATDKHYVWFLKFPLDEQGLLLQAARDEFLVMLLDRVGECMLAAEDGKNIEGALKDSPYTFTPREDKMAVFNAQATKSLAKEPSQYYADALAYFTGQKDINAWQLLGFQGVADVAIRLESHEEILALANMLPLLPEQPFTALSQCLESVKLGTDLIEVLAQRLNVELQENEPNIAQVCACLRAVSNSPAKGLVDQMVMQVLLHQCSKNIEILAIISGRIWRILEQEDMCQLFTEQLANNDAGQSGFSQLLLDVMFVPRMRQHIMQALHSPQRSSMLSQAVEGMFG